MSYLKYTHAEWRKLAKKFRRKRLRGILARDRDNAEREAQCERESSPTYQKWLREQETAEIFQSEEEARLAAEREAQWLRVEVEAQRQWRELQKKLELLREEREKQNAKIRLEWEKEQRKLEELKEEKEKEVERKRLEQERLSEEIENFLQIGGTTPEHLKTNSETNPMKPVCPFFKKTSACRFRDGCSRNHIRPGVSRILLIPNFYSHYSLEQTENEHGSDSSLEFESEELYKDYKEFFYDVVSELENYGRLIHFKTCCNHEPHLRGNVYIEYSQTQAAVKCYRALNGRYYGGKQLSAEFSSVESWKSAVCGQFFTKKCPKGNSCNFLHIFMNPGRLYPHYDKPNHKLERRVHSRVDEKRNWRWSESPERGDCRETTSNDWDYCDSPKITSSRSRKHSSSVRESSRKSSRRSRSKSSSRRDSSSRRSSKPKRHRSRSRSRSESESSRKHSEQSRNRSSKNSVK